MRFNARLETSHNGRQHPFKDPDVAKDGSAGIQNAMVKCLFVVNRRCIHKRFLDIPTGKNPEDSNLNSVETMQWILLYLSICHHRCY
jgi:hypothetical protein